MSTLPPTLTPATHVPSERCESETDKALNMAFTTALEGGIGYWSTCSRYKWSIGDEAQTEARDFIAVITEVGDGDEATEHVIDRTVIIRGIRKAAKHGGWTEYHTTALRMLQFGTDDYLDIDMDADTGDLIVQFGLFGEQVYA